MAPDGPVAGTESGATAVLGEDRPEHSRNWLRSDHDRHRDPRHRRSSGAPASTFGCHEYERAGAPRAATATTRPSYGLEAAAALGVDPARMFKTLVAIVDDRLVLALVPVDRELDLKRLADACAGRRAVLAEPAAAERATGLRRRRDQSARAAPDAADGRSTRPRSDHETVFVSAGRRGLQLELAPDDLVRLRLACHRGPRSSGTIAGSTRQCPRAGILPALPGKRQPDRQAQTEERRPPRQTPVNYRRVTRGHRIGTHVPIARSGAPRPSRRVTPLLCRRRHNPPSPRPHAVFRRRGGTSVASPRTTAPSGRPVHRTRPVRLADPDRPRTSVRALASAAWRLNPTPAAAAGMKVVIVVGPVGSSTSNYITSAKQLRRAGSLVRRHRHRDLQPERHLDQGQGGGPGRQRPDLPRPWQRLSEPVRRVLDATPRTGSGSTPRPGTATTTPSTGASTTSRDVHQPRPERGRHPQPPVLRLGQLGMGQRQPDQDGGQAACRQLRRRASCGRTPGPSSPRGSTAPHTC